MFCVFLRFSRNKAQAAQHMAGHQRWIRDVVVAEITQVTPGKADARHGFLMAGT